LQALELTIKSGGWERAGTQCKALLQACPRKSSSELHNRNRAVLSMLLLESRLHSGDFKGIEPGDQKRLFGRWPYSMHAWNLFSRCGLHAMFASYARPLLLLCQFCMVAAHLPPPIDSARKRCTCRCCHDQGSMQTQLVARLLDKSPDSLPLLMQRGHAMLVSGKHGAALKHYFQVWDATGVVAGNAPPELCKQDSHRVSSAGNTSTRQGMTTA